MNKTQKKFEPILSSMTKEEKLDSLVEKTFSEAQNEPFSPSDVTLFGDPLNEPERKSIYALVAYTAFNKGLDQEVVRHQIAEKFGVQDISAIPRDDYNDVVRFIVDINAAGTVQ